MPWGAGTIGKAGLIAWLFTNFVPLRFLLGCLPIGKMGLELLRCADPRDSAAANPMPRLHRERL
jgi:hypothetical protein